MAGWLGRVGVSGLLFLSSGGLMGADWTQWRGPARDGRLDPAGVPAQWGSNLSKTWTREVGEGHSSPLVVGDRIYIHARQGEEEVVMCLNAANGDLVWEDRLVVPYEMDPSATSHGKGPKSTPLADDGSLFTFGITGVLSRFDLASGELKWRKDFSSEYPKTSPLFGVAMSPLLAGGKLIAHVGGHDGGALTAFDVESGQVVWAWKGDGPGYASPVVFEAEGTRQVVTQTQDWLVSLDLSDGSLLWKLPFSTNYYQNSVTPVVVGDLLVFSGLDKGVTAVRPRKTAGNWEAEEVWANRQVSFYMSTPVLVEGRLYGLSHKRRGQFVSLDAATGKMIWGSPGREGENAAVLASDRYVFFLTDNADLTVVEAGQESYQLLARSTVAESPTWAHPVILTDGVLIKDLKHLTRWTVAP